MSLIVIRPLVTEKSVDLTKKSKNRQYVFVVDINANKIQIKQAIENQFGVQVESLRTTIKPPRQRRRITRKGILTGKSKPVKKAYVTLTSEIEIDFYQTN